MKQAEAFDYVNTIGNKKRLDTLSYDGVKLVPVLLNRTLAQRKETVLYAQDLNAMHYADKMVQWEYAVAAVPRAYGHSGKWPKKIDPTDEQKAIAKYYQVSIDVAADYMLVLSDDAIDSIVNAFGRPDEKI